jgi:hypothetical protein
MRIVGGVQLEKHVPIPKVQPHGRWLPVLLAMQVTTEQQVGESFLVKSYEIARSVHGCARQKGMQIKSTKQSDGRFRIWRVK